MPSQLSCSCGKVLQVQNEFTGEQVTCPECGAVLTARRPSGRRLAAWSGVLLVAAGIILLLLSRRTERGDWEGTRVRGDLHAFHVALDSFHRKFRCYPPSYIHLANSREAYDQANLSHMHSLTYLAMMWPALDWAEPIDWSGGVEGFTGAYLEGDQCLVFFLTGIKGIGFSHNPSNPTQLGGRRVGPFLESLEPARLVRTRAAGNPFPSYLDVYRNVGANPKPYLYFSAGRRKDGYAEGDPVTYGVKPFYGVRPYVQDGRFFNRDTFQIICAGRDQQFGPGGAWSPDRAEAIDPQGLTT